MDDHVVLFEQTLATNRYVLSENKKLREEHRLLGPIYTVRFLYQHFKTCFKMHATKTVPCKSALRKLLQRAIHTSPVCSSAQAFRTRDTHFPLFVCRRRLRGIHTFAFRQRLSERGVHTFRSSPVSLSAQAFRTRHKHFPMFVC